MFARQEMTEEELLDDAECLAGLRRVGAARAGQAIADLDVRIPRPGDRSCVRDLTSRWRAAASPRRAGDWTRSNASRACAARRRRAACRDRIDLGPGSPDRSRGHLATRYFASPTALIAKSAQVSRAARRFCGASRPSCAVRRPGSRSSSSEATSAAADVAEAIAKLDGSYLFIQGPPGAGKTYTGSHAIVELMRRGFRIGVTSNSHKAINNLLEAVERVAAERGLRISRRQEDAAATTSKFERQPASRMCSTTTTDGDAATTSCSPAQPGCSPTGAAIEQLDFLFVDEAGQVSLANVVAMGTCARNIVLLGDQMQLGQPIQGVHPGGSGRFVARISARRRRRRSRPIAASFSAPPGECIRMSAGSSRTRSTTAACSRAAQRSAGTGARQRRHPELRPAGIRFIEATARRAARSEARRKPRSFASLVENLLTQRFRDKTASSIRMTARQHPGRRAVQRAGESAEARAAGRCARRHRRQVPGPGGRGGHRVDDHIERRRTCRASWTSCTARID